MLYITTAIVALTAGSQLHQMYNTQMQGCSAQLTVTQLHSRKLLLTLTVKHSRALSAQIHHSDYELLKGLNLDFLNTMTQSNSLKAVALLWASVLIMGNQLSGK